MKIAHEDVDRIPAPHMAMLIDIGWVAAWPFEIRRDAVRFIRKHGWHGAMVRAAEIASEAANVA